MMSSTTSGSIDGQVRAERLARDRAQPVDRLPAREEREVGAEEQLVLDAVLDRACTSALQSSQRRETRPETSA